MDNPLIFSLAVLAGFMALIYGADKFVHGASTTARHLGVSPLVIGLTIVALGTSAPEIFTSAVAALTGSPEIAIGNVIGSNIANIGLVLGCTALIAPLTLPASLMRQEIPALLFVTLLTLALFIDGNLDWIDGLILLILLTLFSWRMYNNSSEIKNSSELVADSDIAEYLTDQSTTKATIWLLAGVFLMIVGSSILVWGARNLALSMGVSELVVGLTVVAIGTSLPELATSVTSALKGHFELAIGNVVGSNILNLLLVLPVPAFIQKVELDRMVLVRDYTVMLALTLLLAALVYFLLPRKQQLGRKSGVVFITFYLAYTALLIVKPS